MHNRIARTLLSLALATMALNANISVAQADEPDMFPELEATPGAKFIAIQLGMTALELKKAALVTAFPDPAKSIAYWYRRYEARLADQIKILREVYTSNIFDVTAQARSIEASLLTQPEQIKLQEAIAEYGHYRKLLTYAELKRLKGWADKRWGGFKPNIYGFSHYFRNDGTEVASSFALHDEERSQLIQEAEAKILAAKKTLSDRLAALGEPLSTASVYSSVGQEAELQKSLERLRSPEAQLESALNLERLELKLQSKIARRELMMDGLTLLEDPMFHQPKLLKAFSTLVLALAAYDVSVRLYVLANGRDPGFFPGKRLFDATLDRIVHGKSKIRLPVDTEDPL